MEDYEYTKVTIGYIVYYIRTEVLAQINLTVLSDYIVNNHNNTFAKNRDHLTRLVDSYLNITE